MKPLHHILCLVTVCLFFLNPIKLLGEEPSLINLIQKANHSVVDVQADSGGAFRGKPVGFIDKNTGRMVVSQPVRALQYSRNGAGIILDPKGIIATNAHTIKQAGRITVTFYDRTKTTAKLLKAFPDDDIAFLQIIPPFRLEKIQLANSNDARVGDVVYSIGHSKLLKGSFGEGKITGMSRQKTNGNWTNGAATLIQVNFNVYTGDSGSPVLDRNGRMIGFIVARLVPQANASFAIPSNRIKSLFNDAWPENGKITVVTRAERASS